MAESEQILQLGIDAARAGNRAEARNLFSLLTRQEPNNASAWLWLAGVADSPDERQAALERVLELDPTNEMARKSLQAMGISKPAAPASTASSWGEAPAASTPPPPVAAPAPAAPAAPARELSDEELYAAELDMAFDDYDEVPRAESPRVSAADVDLDLGIDYDELDRGNAAINSAAASSASSSSSSRFDDRSSSSSSSERRTARERSAARRNTTTPVHSGGDDEYSVAAMAAKRNKGRGGLLPLLIGALVLAVLLFLVWNFFSNRQTASEPSTPTNDPGIVATPTLDPGVAIEPSAEPTADNSGEGGEGGEATGEGGEATGEGGEGGEATPEGSEPSAPVVPPANAEALAAANPQPVEIGADVSANGWRYTFPGVCLGSCAVPMGNQIGGFTANGTYVMALMFVANETGNPSPLPADFFVLKDDQGRVYNAVVDVSNAYVIPGVNADIGHGTAVPANGAYTSIPVFFDVQPGSNNLVLFSSSNLEQGWPVLSNVP